MKFLLLCSLMITMNAQAAAWTNFATVNFSSTARVGAYSGGVPLSTAPTISYASTSAVNFDNCQYRIKTPAASQLNESFTGTGGGWAAASNSGVGATYYNLNHTLKYGNLWRMNFNTLAGGTINFQVIGTAFSASVGAPIKSQINATVAPGYYKVTSAGLIIQSACEPTVIGTSPSAAPAVPASKF